MNDNNEELIQLAKDFLQLVERAYNINRANWKNSKRAGNPKKELPFMDEEEAPRCPKCGGVMVMRVAKKGPMAGHPFWACKNYPKCNGTAKCEE